MSAPNSLHFTYQLREGFYYECIFHRSTREAVEGWYRFLVETIEQRAQIGITVLLLDLKPTGLPPLQPFVTRVNDFRREYPSRESTIVAIEYKDSFILTIAGGLMKAMARSERKDQQQFFHNTPREQTVAWLREVYRRATDNPTG